MAADPPSHPGRDPRWEAFEARAASLLGPSEAAFLCDKLRTAASQRALALAEARVDARLQGHQAEQRVAIGRLERRFIRSTERLDRWVAMMMAATWLAGAATVIVTASVS